MVITCVSCHVILFVLLEMSIPYSQNENCRCLDIFTPKEKEILLKYRKEHFPEKIFDCRRRRLIGKWPLTPEEVLILLIDIVPDVC